jgi:hypothetical protein
MINRALLAVVAVAAFGAPAMAQESGGLRLAPNVGAGPVGLARPLPFTRQPFLTAHDLQNGMTAADHQAADQNAITQLRGDPGFLAGFLSGTPLAASRQPQPAGYDGGTWYHQHHHGHGSGPTIINNSGPLAVTVGNGNVIQQQSANGSGPIALQQVATTPAAGSHGGGASNNVLGSGNIIQRAPSGH